MLHPDSLGSLSPFLHISLLAPSCFSLMASVPLQGFRPFVHRGLFTSPGQNGNLEKSLRCLSELDPGHQNSLQPTIHLFVALSSPPHLLADPMSQLPACQPLNHFYGCQLCDTGHKIAKLGTPVLFFLTLSCKSLEAYLTVSHRKPHSACLPLVPDPRLSHPVWFKMPLPL